MKPAKSPASLAVDPATDLMRALLAEVRALTDEVRVLRREIAARPAKGGSRVTHLIGPFGRQTDPQAEAADLLLAISDAIGSRLFTAVELLAHAELVTSAPLRLAIAAAGCASTPRSVGKLLASIEGENLSGRRALKVGTERAGAIWRIEVCKP